MHIKTTTSREKYPSHFTYKNNSNKVIKFTKLRASCGCILVDAPTHVKPGETGKISFRAPVPRAGGSYTKVITVNTDESDKGTEYKLTLKVTNTDKATRKLTPLVNNFAKEDHQRPSKEYINLGYQRPSKMTSRSLLIEKLLAKQALTKKNTYTKQIDCPFLPLPISLKLFHDFQGMRIYTCCEQCLIKVKESPHHAIIKLAEKAQTPISIPQNEKITNLPDK